MPRKTNNFANVNQDNVSNSNFSTIQYKQADKTYYIEHATQIKTNKVGRSIQVLDNDDTTAIIHFLIDEVTGWDLVDNMLRVYTSDSIPTVIRFSSNDEAQQADNRFNNIMNGDNI